MLIFTDHKSINYLSYLLAEIPSMFIALATIMKKRGFPLRESRGIFFGGSTHGSLPSDQVLASYYFFLGFGKILATTTILRGQSQTTISFLSGLLSLGITANHLSLSSCFLGNLNVFSFLSLS